MSLLSWILWITLMNWIKWKSESWIPKKSFPSWANGSGTQAESLRMIKVLRFSVLVWWPFQPPKNAKSKEKYQWRDPKRTLIRDVVFSFNFLFVGFLGFRSFRRALHIKRFQFLSQQHAYKLTSKRLTVVQRLWNTNQEQVSWNTALGHKKGVGRTVVETCFKSSHKRRHIRNYKNTSSLLTVTQPLWNINHGDVRGEQISTSVLKYGFQNFKKG